MTLSEQLKAAGFDDTQTKTAENILRQFIAGEYIPKDRFNEVNDKSKALAQEIGRLESEKEALEKRAKKAEDGLTPLQEKLSTVETEWKTKYDQLQADYKKKEEDRIALETYNTRLDAVKKYIGDSAYDAGMVTALIDFNTLEIKDGAVIGADKAVEAIRKEKPFLFKSDDWSSTAPISAPKGETSKNANFGELLAKQASKIDEQTSAAAKKYFG